MTPMHGHHIHPGLIDHTVADVGTKVHLRVGS
jgi:hypothetical protein